jgi:hypothetical protein
MKQFLFISILFLSACGNVGGLNLAQYPDPEASKDKFMLCHGYGCSYKTITNFTEKEWHQVQKIFSKKSKTPEAERIKIGQAIALMERQMGAAIGTNIDLPKAPLTRQSVKELDCIDETINTTKYLGFLESEDLLKFHTAGRPVYKGYMVNGVYPHNSATIQEIETGDIYVVDSYIYANGEKPNIRLLDSWLKYRVDELEDVHNLNAVAVESFMR